MDEQNSNAAINAGTSSSAGSTSQDGNEEKSATNSAQNKKLIPEQEENLKLSKAISNVANVINQGEKKQGKKKVLLTKSQDKKKAKPERDVFLGDLNDESFEIDDIIRNPQALKLIEDLVNCFTCNSTLPETELSVLKLSLFQRACSVFLELLNECVEKTFNKVINSHVIAEFKKKSLLLKRDIGCQTTFQEVPIGEKTKVQQDVST